MLRSWKKLAERADNAAFDIDQIAEAIPTALDASWRKLPSGLVDELGKLMETKNQSSLFGVKEDHSQQIDTLKRTAAESPLGRLLVNHAEHVLAENTTYKDGMEEAMMRALSTHSSQVIWQIEEHYHRHPKSSTKRAIKVRVNLEAAHQKQSWAQIAKGLRSGVKKNVFKISKKSGLDEGVKLK